MNLYLFFSQFQADVQSYALGYIMLFSLNNASFTLSPFYTPLSYTLHKHNKRERTSFMLCIMQSDFIPMPIGCKVATNHWVQSEDLTVTTCWWRGMKCYIYCLTTPGLSKDIQCHVWQFSFLCLNITRLDIIAHVNLLPAWWSQMTTN